MGKVWSINNNFGKNKRIKENYIFIVFIFVNREIFGQFR